MSAWCGWIAANSLYVHGHPLYRVLMTEPNAPVGAFQPTAMPVILTTLEEIDLWMMAWATKVLKQRRPLQGDALA